MPWFFTDEIITENQYTLTGETAKHIEKSLRMKPGEELTLCDPARQMHHCTVDEIHSGEVRLRVVNHAPCDTEPSVSVTLYQALPKGDKMDMIVQKAVELGVTKIVPVLSARCISRPDGKSLSKKTARWQKIALQAAMQSRRGIIPRVEECISFHAAAQQCGAYSKTILFYECGGKNIDEIFYGFNSGAHADICFFIGSEGGFEEEEVQQVLSAGGCAATLGKRILRAETAPIAALTLIMHATGNI